MSITLQRYLTQTQSITHSTFSIHFYNAGAPTFGGLSPPPSPPPPQTPLMTVRKIYIEQKYHSRQIAGDRSQWRELMAASTAGTSFVMTTDLTWLISEIFNVEKYRDLEIHVKGQSRSLKVVTFDRPGMVPTVFYSNFVSNTHRF